MRRPPIPVLALVAALLAGGSAGCGSQDDVAAFPPAAEPARSPVQRDALDGRVVRVGPGAEGVAVDERTGLVAVAVRDPARLVLLDARTLRVRRRVALPGAARHVVVAPGGGRLLVPVDGTRTVVEVALPSGRSRALRVGRPVHDALRAGGRVLRGDAVVRVPGGPVARIDARARRLALLDAATGRQLARAPAGVGPAHAAAGDGGRVYVTDGDGGAVLLFRTRPEPALARRYGLPGAPYAATVDREKGKLWVTLTARNEVVQLTADAQPREQRRYATVRQPNSLAVEDATGRVFVAGRAEGTLHAFDGYARDP